MTTETDTPRHIMPITDRIQEFLRANLHSKPPAMNAADARKQATSLLHEILPTLRLLPVTHDGYIVVPGEQDVYYTAPFPATPLIGPPRAIRVGQLALDGYVDGTTIPARMCYFDAVNAFDEFLEGRGITPSKAVTT